MPQVTLASSHKPLVQPSPILAKNGKVEAESAALAAPHYVPLMPALARDTALLQKALTCPDVQKLYLEASKLGPWQIVFNPAGSYTDFNTKTLFINKSYSDDKALACFIFQLIQISQANEIQNLHDRAAHGKIDAASFVKERERLQHTACLLHHKIAQNAVQVLKWNPSIDKYALTNPNFEKHWQKLLDKKKERIRLKIANSAEALKLYLTVNQENPFVLHLDQPRSHRKGETFMQKRIIVVDPSLSEEETLAIYLIELLNASRAADFLKLAEEARQGIIDKEAFAKAMEKIEHANCLLHHKIVIQSKWDPKVDIYKGMDFDFEKVWNDIKNSQHTEHYRIMWEKLRMQAEDKARS